MITLGKSFQIYMWLEFHPLKLLLCVTEIGKTFSLLTNGVSLDHFKGPELTTDDLCDVKQKLPSFACTSYFLHEGAENLQYLCLFYIYSDIGKD